MGITWKDLKLWNCKAKKQNKPLSVEAPWACSWIAFLIDKLYLSLKKTHPAFLVISTWFGSGWALWQRLWEVPQMYFPEELGIMGTEFWKNCYLAPIWELPEYDSLKKTQLIPALGAVKWNSQSWSANWALPKQDGEHVGIMWASSSGTITTVDVCGCKTAPSLSEPVRPGCGLIFCPFKLSHILSTA